MATLNAKTAVNTIIRRSSLPLVDIFPDVEESEVTGPELYQKEYSKALAELKKSDEESDDVRNVEIEKLDSAAKEAILSEESSRYQSELAEEVEDHKPVVVVESETPPDFSIELIRYTQKQLSPTKMGEQIEYIVSAMLGTGVRKDAWEVEILRPSPVFAGMSKTYTYSITFNLKPKNYIKGKTEVMFDALQSIVTKAAVTQRWEVKKYGSEQLLEGKERTELEVPDDWYNAYFGHIYDREPQIKILMSAINAGMKSNFENRFHTVLYGPPACGKTEITRSFKEMFGEDAVMEYDATATTQAGAIRDLAERDSVPQLLIIEEIEKTDEASLRWLLSVLDHRGEIRKTNYKVQIQREIKLMCIATVNDFELFNKLMYGALASRFTHKLYCPRPNEEILRRILSREVNRVEGDHAWITPAIEYATKHGMNDPRQVTAICLSGREDLLNGSYQKMLSACEAPTIETIKPKTIETLEKKVVEKVAPVEDDNLLAAALKLNFRPRR